MLEGLRGIVFVDRFSYADVLDSRKGWAGGVKFKDDVFCQFEAFCEQKDTFSLGVCNGSQLVAFLGWIPGDREGGSLSKERQPRLLENKRSKFESRFSSARIEEGPTIMFKGMGGSSLDVWVAHGKFCDNNNS